MQGKFQNKFQKNFLNYWKMHIILLPNLDTVTNLMIFYNYFHSKLYNTFKYLPPPLITDTIIPNSQSLFYFNLPLTTLIEKLRTHFKTTYSIWSSVLS